jgi:PTS system nitrogen regulatory IIA component
MGNETLDLPGLASYLGRDARELSKLASRGHLPGRKVGGEWRFAVAEINHWLERQMSGLTDRELGAFDPVSAQAAFPLISNLLTEACIDLSLRATTKSSVLRELVHLAENSGLVFDFDAIHGAIQAREDLGSTAWEVGVAIPHPRRRLPGALGDSVIAMARTSSGIPFGAPRGGLTDLFFLVCCDDDQTHLRVLARLARLVKQPGLLDSLRQVEFAADAWGLIESAENAWLESQAASLN